jgi:hypothetical protein
MNGNDRFAREKEGENRVVFLHGITVAGLASDMASQSRDLK